MRLFISYAHVDKRQVRELVEILREGGDDPWFDHKMMVGQDWQAQLREAIEFSDAFVYALSPEAVNSEWCQWELAQAVRLSKPVIPVLLQVGTPLPDMLRSIHYCDFTDGATGQSVARLGRALRTAQPIPIQDVFFAPTKPSGLPAQALDTTMPLNFRRLLTPRKLLLLAGMVAVLALVIGMLSGFLGQSQAGDKEVSLVGALAVEPSLTPSPEPATATPIPSETPRSIEAATETALVIARNADWTPILESFEGVEMVQVPTGCFVMGDETGDRDERPLSQQCFAQPFWIDRTEVSNGQFERLAGKSNHTGNWTGADFPRERITWFEARDFCALRGGRLPTEAEWEYAARGVDNLVFPWGSEFDAEKTIYFNSAEGRTAKVGSNASGASWVGALDMSGNVWEWTSTRYETYPYAPDDGREAATDEVQWYVVRGGSWLDQAADVRAANRFSYNTVPSYFIGFRCVRDG